MKLSILVVNPFEQQHPTNKVQLPFDSHNHIQLGGEWLSLLRAPIGTSSTGSTASCVVKIPREDDNNKYNYGSGTALQQQPQQLNCHYDRDAILTDIQTAVPNCCGMAVMSTHPRDFEFIQRLSSGRSDTTTTTTNTTATNTTATSTATATSSTTTATPTDPPTGTTTDPPTGTTTTTTTTRPFQIIPCFGVHPWFVHELSNDDWQPTDTTTGTGTAKVNTTTTVGSITSTPDRTTAAVAVDVDTTDVTTFETANFTMADVSSLVVPRWGIEDDDIPRNSHHFPQWLVQMERYIRNNPNAIVGEIGLDKFHFTVNNNYDMNYNDNDNDDATNRGIDRTTRKQLSTPIEIQIQVFQLQMELAIRYQRPVCIHCVHAFGPLLDLLANMKQKHCQKSNNTKKKNQTTTMTFPLSKLYFHAYGGKLNTVAQILAICEGTNKNNSNKSTTKTNASSTTTTTDTISTGGRTKCYFGFAPCVNFRSPKTVDIIRTIGLSRIVLESDLEDVSRISSSLEDGIRYISDVFNVDPFTVIEQTTNNAIELYNITAFEL